MGGAFEKCWPGGLGESWGSLGRGVLKRVRGGLGGQSGRVWAEDAACLGFWWSGSSLTLPDFRLRYDIMKSMNWQSNFQYEQPRLFLGASLRVPLLVAGKVVKGAFFSPRLCVS